jgi:chromosome segregation ATPase
VDFAQLKSSDATGRVKELEANLENLRRKLSEERQIKENFEDLLDAVKGQIAEHRNERDNLRDEIVPQLRARVEGLETEAAEFQRLTYENTRMQQELQSLKNENNTLVQARRTQTEMQLQGSRINSISEEGQLMKPGPGLSRANSTARSSLTGGKGGLTRSNSLKERESRESLADRVKDIEAQRDALHRALKNLLERQEFQNRENEKRIKALEYERDQALSGSPRRMGYDREVTNLREEINHLRKRADEALEQKWQCEKGLSGLKMDLDRAEQETSSLRVLLSEHDILVPNAPTETRKNPEIQLNGISTSDALERAYNELQTTHARSLTRIRELEAQGGGKFNPDADEKVKQLQESMAAAEAERDQARREADDHRMQAKSFQTATDAHVKVEKTLADQLRNSAARVEELASQVRLQLASNNSLREKLAEAISRGEREQKSSASKITEMQRRLKNMEDQLVTAQQHTEESVALHEEEVRDLKDSHNTQLQRMKSGVKISAANQTKNSLSPLFMGRSPKLDQTTSGESMSMTDITRTEELESRVKDLEKALGVADKEMEEVVGRMNKAQIEVMELQSARDEAMRATRRLHGAIGQEKARVQVLMA